MYGDGSVISGVVKSKDDLIIIDEHRVQEGLDQPLLTFDVRVVHSGKLMEEEHDMLFLQGQILFQFGCCQCHMEILFLLLQLIHAVLGALIEDMWMERIGILIFGELIDTEEPYFIPSACWRKIGKGILSTTRFAGMLMAYDKRYAVFDIGDGTMEWQLRAESSLFYYKYGSFETKTDGMILICDDGNRDEIARQIIRQTMWSRKMLLKGRYAETDKPVRYSKSPIKLRTQYEHVYLTTPNTLSKSLDRIYDEDYYIEKGVKGAVRLGEPKLGDVELYPNRYYLNPAFDILKLVYFFSEVKGRLDDPMDGYVSPIVYFMVVYPEDLEVARMYPDVNEAKGVNIRVYRSA